MEDQTIHVTDAEAEAESAHNRTTRDGDKVEMHTDQKFLFTLTSSVSNRHFKTKELTLQGILKVFRVHVEAERKDGPCFMSGHLLGERRLAVSVPQVDCLVYDIDGTQTWQEIDASLDAGRIVAVLYTTYNHLSTTTEIQTTAYSKWAARVGEREIPDLDAMLKYLAQNKKGHLKNVTLRDGTEHTSDGVVYVVTHAPVHKVRIVIPLARPIVIKNLAPDTERAIQVFKSIYHGVGEALGLKFDVSCSDPSRLHYLPSHPKGAKNDTFFTRRYLEHPKTGAKFGLMDWTAYPRVDPRDNKLKIDTANGRLKQRGSEYYRVKDRAGHTIDLKRWAAQCGKDFDIEGVLATHAPDTVGRSRASGSGFHIVCPFEAEHTTPGGTGTWCANCDSERSWQIACCHNACKAAGRDRLDFLRQLILDGYLTAANLGCPEQSATPNKGFSYLFSKLQSKAW